MAQNNRYGTLFDGIDEKPKRQIYSHLIDEAEQKSAEDDRYGDLFERYARSSSIAGRVTDIKAKVKSANKDEARNIKNSFFDNLKECLERRSFALYENDGTVAAFVFDDLVECQSFVSNNPSTLKPRSFRELLCAYERYFRDIDAYSVVDNKLIIRFNDRPNSGSSIN